MTGPEHYREAERLALLTRAYHDRHAGRALAEPEADELHRTIAAGYAEAQVHATLALAAALAGLDAAEGPGGGSATGRMTEDANEWARAVAPLVPTDGAS